MSFDVDRLRARIPALRSGVAFFDGPGGTQTPDLVADAVAGALVAGVSNRGSVTVAEQHAEAIVQAARQAGADLVGAQPNGIVFGRSATELTFMVARTLSQEWAPGDEVVVTRLDHDSNIRPWVRYAERSGATVRWIDFDPMTGELDLEDLPAVVNGRTRVVALTGASNVLGTRPDLDRVVALAHRHGALVYVDGVHLVAHDQVDLATLGADFLVCSPYKFLGPHLGMLAASAALLESMHPDKLLPSTEEVPERFELGTLPYELLAGVVAAVDMLADLVPGDEASLPRRERLARSFAALHDAEAGLRDRLRDGLASIGGITFYSNAVRRTPTELFAVDGIASADVYRALAERDVNAPAGSFYAIEACPRLGLGAAGAVRAGIAPYTNTDDVDRLIAGVREIASGR